MGVPGRAGQGYGFWHLPMARSGGYSATFAAPNTERVT